MQLKLEGAPFKPGDDARLLITPPHDGTALVTAGAVAVAMPLGVLAAICLSDVLPFFLRQLVKPVIEILAAIPSVAYGFFALVVLAPLLQERGGGLLALAGWVIGAPVGVLAVAVLSDVASQYMPKRARLPGRIVVALALAALAFAGLRTLTGTLGVSTIVGSRVWDRQLKFRLICGPMGLEDYERLLPDRQSLARFEALVRLYTTDEYVWDLQLVLRQEEVPQIELGRSGRLGWTTWRAA